MAIGIRPTSPQLITLLAALAAGSLAASAQTPQTPNQQPLPQTPPLTPGGELPKNPSPAASEEMLLPGEILLNPPAANPPAGAVQPSGQKSPSGYLKKPPVEIQRLLPPMPRLFLSGGEISSQMRVRVKGFRFTGNHVFSDHALQKVVAKYTGREVTSMELEEARQALTLKYVEAGYINSGAVLPDQDPKDDILTFKIVEGRLTTVELKGEWWFRPWWLRHALRQAAGTPLNFNRLKTGLQLLRQDPNIKQINAELEPGNQPGESILKADVKENEPFHFGIDFSNKRPPSVGSELVEAHASDLNLTGHGDPLSVTWGLARTTSDGINEWKYSGDENYGGSYQFPITPWKTTLELHASKSDAAIVEAPFTTLNIQSRIIEYGATLRQPFYESLNDLFAVSLTADWRKSQTDLLGQPFDLSPGAINGLTQVFVLRLSMEYVNRSQQHVLALRSTFNIGLEDFGATRQVQSPPKAAGQFVQTIPDGQFFDWLGQAQYVRRLFNTDNVVVLRANAQFSSDPLVSLEQFSLGGVESIRGYRENQLLRDNGVFGSIEFRSPVWRNKAKNPIVTLAPFFDIGGGWNTVQYVGPTPPNVDDQFQWISSVGVGIIFTPSKYVTGQLYWGYALNPSQTVPHGNNLQDDGIHFTLSVNAF